MKCIQRVPAVQRSRSWVQVGVLLIAVACLAAWAASFGLMVKENRKLAFRARSLLLEGDSSDGWGLQAQAGRQPETMDSTSSSSSSRAAERLHPEKQQHVNRLQSLQQQREQQHWQEAEQQRMEASPTQTAPPSNQPAVDQLGGSEAAAALGVSVASQPPATVASNTDSSDSSSDSRLQPRRGFTFDSPQAAMPPAAAETAMPLPSPPSSPTHSFSTQTASPTSSTHHQHSSQTANSWMSQRQQQQIDQPLSAAHYVRREPFQSSPAKPPLPEPVYVSADAAAMQTQVELSRRPVDAVYLWVNGTDPELQQELQQLQQTLLGPQSEGHHLALVDNPAKQARFDAGRDELRYSIRSLEKYMPWYRHLYIVTNRQVPSWLDTANPRVTVVPHSSIFPNPSHMPSFNSVAIQANLANIPGLSDAFVLMDDDWFLTADWTLKDFAADDGGQYLTGSTPANTIKPTANTYLNMVRNLDATYLQRFGPWPRHDPSHSPHYMQLHWLQLLQRELADVFASTSAAHFRTPKDLLLAAGYQWYVAQHQPGTHATLPDNLTSFVAVNDAVGRTTLAAATEDLRSQARAGDKAAVAIMDHYKYHTQVVEAAAEHAGSAGSGPRLSARIETFKRDLLKAWISKGSKVVCLQDDLSDAQGSARRLLDPVIREFLEKQYPIPSQYELPAGQSNGCRHRLAVTVFGQLPSTAEYTAACKEVSPS